MLPSIISAISKQRQRFCILIFRRFCQLLELSHQAVDDILCLGIIFCWHQPSRLITAAVVVVFGGNCLKQKFGFMKGVDKG